MTSGDSEVTSFDGSHLEVAVEGRKLAYTLRFTFYKAVARKTRTHVTRNAVTSFQVSGSDPEVTSFDPVTWKWV